MTARILALMPSLRYRLALVHLWQLALCAFWFGGAR